MKRLFKAIDDPGDSICYVPYYIAILITNNTCLFFHFLTHQLWGPIVHFLSDMSHPLKSVSVIHLACEWSGLGMLRPDLMLFLSSYHINNKMHWHWLSKYPLHLHRFTQMHSSNFYNSAFLILAISLKRNQPKQSHEDLIFLLEPLISSRGNK